MATSRPGDVDGRHHTIAVIDDQGTRVVASYVRTPRCPDCGSRLEFTKGTIVDRVVVRYHRRGSSLKHRARPAGVWACPGCEFVVEATAQSFAKLAR